MKKLITILLASLLMGCAASNPQQAREMGADRRYTFQVETGYQTVYRRILDTARKCLQYPVGTAIQLVNGDLYSDSRTGSITVGMYGAVGTSIYQVIDVRGLDDMRTEVIAIFPMGPVKKIGSKVKAWANGNSECSATSNDENY